MSLFRRQKKSTDESVGTGAAEVGDVEVDDAAGTGAEATTTGDTASGDTASGAAATNPAGSTTTTTTGVPFDRSAGPFDESEVEAEDTRLVLGGLRLAGRNGMELRFEVEEATQRVIAVSVGLDGSTVQLQAFAAPRSAGVWDEIRPEIATAVTGQGGAADEVAGVFGTELLCRLPVRTEDGRTAHQPTRFAGIDGPRWFLRAVFSGPAAHDPAAAAELEGVVRDVVVVRGGEAMAPRELIALALPPSPEQQEEAAAEAVAAAAAAAPATSDDLKPFERGPEITEVR